MQEKPLVDTKCFELAEAFLSDVPADRKWPGDTMALAHEIQMAIEDFLQVVEARAPMQGLKADDPLPRR